MAMNAGAKQLADALKERGSQQVLADALGVDAGIVSRWRTGKLGPGAGYRLKLQERLGIPWQSWDEEQAEESPPAATGTDGGGH